MEGINKFETLFRPLKINNLTLRNRIVMAPMTRSMSSRGIPTQEVADYYAVRARAECGLIITEGVEIEHKASSGYPDVPHFYGEEAIAGWRRVVESVHAAGGAIFPQLWHVGSVRKKGMPPNPEVPGYAPSPEPNPINEDASEIPKEMSLKDINEVITAYVESARNAKQIGFDGVEIHGAHGYLIDQFLWKHTNLRTDSYGGSMVKRTRLAKEIIMAVRQEVGEEYPIVFRYSQWKNGAFDAKLAHTPAELEKFLDILVDAGVDLFHCSTRRYWEPEFEGSKLNLAGWTKKLTGKPSISVGSIGLDNETFNTLMGEKTSMTGIDRLLEMMANDEFDLIAIGRMYLCDPKIAEKLHEGRLDDIIKFDVKCLEKLVR